MHICWIAQGVHIYAQPECLALNQWWTIDWKFLYRSVWLGRLSMSNHLYSPDGMNTCHTTTSHLSLNCSQLHQPPLCTRPVRLIRCVLDSLNIMVCFCPHWILRQLLVRPKDPLYPKMHAVGWCTESRKGLQQFLCWTVRVHSQHDWKSISEQCSLVTQTCQHWLSTPRPLVMKWTGQMPQC